MKPLLVATIVGIAAGGGATQLRTVKDFVADIYPNDPTKRQALALCILADAR